MRTCLPIHSEALRWHEGVSPSRTLTPPRLPCVCSISFLPVSLARLWAQKEETSPGPVVAGGDRNFYRDSDTALRGALEGWGASPLPPQCFSCFTSELSAPVLPLPALGSDENLWKAGPLYFDHLLPSPSPHHSMTLLLLFSLPSRSGNLAWTPRVWGAGVEAGLLPVWPPGTNFSNHAVPLSLSSQGCLEAKLNPATWGSSRNFQFLRKF